MHRDKINNEQIINVLYKQTGFLSEAAKKLKISRKTLYNWINDDEELQEAVKDCRESLIDLAESKLFEQIEKGNITAIIFLLKTLGKNRGYVERQEYAEHVEQPLFPMDEFTDDGTFPEDDEF